MKCDICNCTDTYIKEHTHEYIIKGKKIEFISKRRFCKNCNNLVYDSKLDNIASKKAIEIYNKKYGVSKESIIELRKKYNLSQDLFSKIIGCAKKTLVSYENGNSIPNDNYLIILRSLINKPEVIYTLIESNKDKFTDIEYNKIKDRLDYDTILFSDEKFTPSKYNGYTKLNMDKVYNMILCFAESKVLKTKLLKEMFYADFINYKNTGASITGLEYAKLNYGPVPNNYEEIIFKCSLKDLINYDVEFKNDFERHYIEKKAKLNKKIFSEEEYNSICKVKKFFQNYNSSDIVKYSHKEKAFTDTKYFNNISYDYAFDLDI